MSTYSVAVSGPDTRLAFLRALAIRAAHRTGQFLATIKQSLAAGTRLARTVSSAALALLGSDTGYQAARTLTRTAISTGLGVLTSCATLLGRVVRAGGTAVGAVITWVSPTAAATLHHHLQQRLADPVATALGAAHRWITRHSERVWALSDTALTRALTVRAAQSAGIALAVHALTQGAAAAKIITVLPWLMDTIVWLTNPTHALLLVAAAFGTGMALSALTSPHRTGRPDPDHPHTRASTRVLPDPGTPALIASPRTPDPAQDLRRIAAALTVEISPDGSVHVHGIPTDIPPALGTQIARIATDAATARLDKLLTHRPTLTRDDRRLLTKTARDAIRTHARTPATTAGTRHAQGT